MGNAVHDLSVNLYGICAWASTGNRSCGYRQNRNQTTAGCISCAGCDFECTAKYTVYYFVDIGDPAYQIYRGAVLWVFGYSRTTGYRCRFFTIIWKVLLVEARTSLIVGVTIALGTILGYSAMAGAVGGGGLGNIAIRYGYYRYQPDIMIVTIVILIVLVQILQGIGMLISAKLDRRK